MKDKIFCMLCMVGMFTFVAAQENERIIKVDTEGTCETIPASHWSTGIKTGASKYLMPPVSPTEYDRLNLVYGGMVEYTFNPFVGVGLEYNHNDYSRPYTYTSPTTHIVSNGNLRGGTNDYIVYGSVNLSNAFAPFRNGYWKYLNIYGDIGGGIAFYHYALNFNPLSTKEAMMAKLGLNAEFTLSKVFNLCFSGQYNQYDALRMAKSTAHKNCDAYICTLALRYKIGSSKSKHVRNLNRCDYAYKPIPVLIKKVYVKGETEESLNRLKNIERENVAMNQAIQKMEEETKNATILEEKPSEDLTLQQKLQKMEEYLKHLCTQKEGMLSLSFENIEFKSHSNILAASSYAILNQIALILKTNTFWYGVRVSGHTDNIGSDESNLRLSESRAFSVKKYLISKGIPNHKIVTAGCGETEPVATNDTPEGRQKNRRVEFEIY